MLRIVLLKMRLPEPLDTDEVKKLHGRSPT